MKVSSSPNSNSVCDDFCDGRPHQGLSGARRGRKVIRVLVTVPPQGCPSGAVAFILHCFGELQVPDNI
jgi:hypothetical protein